MELVVQRRHLDVVRIMNIKVYILPKKIIFSLAGDKNVKKFPIFFTLRSGKFFKIALFWEKSVKISIFCGKDCKFRGKKYQNLQFLGLKFHPLLFFPHPLLLFGRIFTYDNEYRRSLNYYTWMTDHRWKRNRQFLRVKWYGQTNGTFFNIDIGF